MECLKPLFPKRHVKPHVDDRRVLSGIILINPNGFRLNEMGAFARSMASLAAEGTETMTIMTDETDLKAHRRASGLRVADKFLTEAKGATLQDVPALIDWADDGN